MSLQKSRLRKHVTTTTSTRWKVWSTALWRSASGSGALGSAPALSRNSAVGFQEGRPFAATLIKPSRDWAREATVGESRLPHVCCKHVTAKVQATVCAHLLEKLQCLLRPCAKFQEPTASPSMSRRPPDPMKERSHDHSENGCLKRYCCNLGRRAGGGGRPAGRRGPKGPGERGGKKEGDNPRVRVLLFACVNSGQACAVRVRELDGDDFETI